MELIKIELSNINNQDIKTVNARELHAFLESKQDYSTWIKSRIETYGFEENADFIRFHKKMEANNATVIEYHISTDMAKELSMVERNEKGKQARQYFIKCEEALKSQVPQIPTNLPDALRLAADLAEENQKLAIERDEAIKTKALIGSKREATAMGKAGALAKEVKKLKEQLDGLKNVFIANVNTEVGRNLREAHMIEYIPSAIFIRNGKPSNPYMGTRAILENAKC